jgi:ABC-type sugar transport system substrate-binding protein
MSPDNITDSDDISIELGDGVSRRDVLKKLSAAGAAMGMAAAAGCQSGSDDTPTDTQGGNGNGNGNGTQTQPSTQEFDFSRHPAVAPPGWDSSKTQSGAGNTERTAVFVYQNSQNPFFVPMTVGFHDALENYGWTGRAVAPATGSGGNPTLQTGRINTQIDQNLEPGDVLVTTVLNTSSFNTVIQRALDNDIVVINGHTTPNPDEWNTEFMTSSASGEGFDSGFRYRNNPMTIPHVGIKDEQAGVAMAAEAYERLQEQTPDPDGGEYTVLMTNGLDINPSVTRRVDKTAASEGTAQRYLEAQSGPGVSLYNGQILSVDPNPVGAESQIKSTVAGDEQEIDAVLSAGYWGAVAAGNLKGRDALPAGVIAGGFDLDQSMINNILDGQTDFTVAQDPYSQGYMNVPLAWIYLERGMEMKSMEWGVSVWDESNIEFADERRNWQDLQDWQESNYTDTLQ